MPTSVQPRSRGNRPRPGHVPVPRLPGRPVTASALDLRRDPLATMVAAERLGPVTRIDAGPPGWRLTLYGVFHPDGVARVLVDDPHRLTKQSTMYRELRRALGAGLFTSEGEVWHHQRRAVAPALTRRQVLGPYAPRPSPRWAASPTGGQRRGRRRTCRRAGRHGGLHRPVHRAGARRGRRRDGAARDPPHHPHAQRRHHAPRPHTAPRAPTGSRRPRTVGWRPRWRATADGAGAGASSAGPGGG